MDQLFCIATHEAVVQTTVVYQLLLMKSRGVQFEMGPTFITGCWMPEAWALLLCFGFVRQQAVAKAQVAQALQSEFLSVPLL